MLISLGHDNLAEVATEVIKKAAPFDPRFAAMRKLESSFYVLVAF